MQITVNSSDILLALNQLGVYLIKELREDLVTKKVNATGNFSRSLEYKINKTGRGYELLILGFRYGGAIEKGRRPGGIPPPSAIKAWIIAKKITYKKGMEFAIAKSIAKKGTAQYQGKGYYMNPITGVLNSDAITDRIFDRAFQGRTIVKLETL